jgi:hypothetical protein
LFGANQSPNPKSLEIFWKMRGAWHDRPADCRALNPKKLTAPAERFHRQKIEFHLFFCPSIKQALVASNKYHSSFIISK